MKHVLTDGAKALNINNLPPEAWQVLGGGNSRDKQAKLYAAVAYFFACADTRIQAAGAMPYEITRGDTVLLSSEDDAPLPKALEWLATIPPMFSMIEAGKILAGQAYLFNERTTMSTRGVRWWLPNSVTPEIDDMNGLTGFKRAMGSGRSRSYDVEDILYFWPPDPYVEIGPARHYPGRAATVPGMALASMDEFITNYFDRGLVKATLLSYTDMSSPDEMQETANWWRRVTSGIKSAFGSMVVRGDFKATVIGEGLKDLSDKTLTQNEKENITVAFRVPMSMVFQKPGGLSDGTDNDERAFVERVVTPSCIHTARCFNDQLLTPLGLHLRFLPQKLSVMQEDEQHRSQAVMNYVAAGVPLDVTLDMLGVTLNEDMRVRVAPVADDSDPTPEAGKVTQAQVLNGAQISSALSIIEGYNAGQYPRENALNMVQTFFNLPAEAANAIVPSSPGTAPTTDGARAAFRRWYRKRADSAPDIDLFKNELLTHEDKLVIVAELGGAVANDTPFKATETQLTRLIERAIVFFSRVYSGQMSRFVDYVTEFGTGSPGDFFGEDEAVVAAAVAPWFDDNLTDAARRAIAELNANVDFDDLASVMALLVEEMADDFASEMTTTSLVQTEAVIAEWLAEGGTIGELTEQLSSVWEGPRPRAAATTESTRLLARGNLEGYKASGVATGYNVETKNDDRVRDEHSAISQNGPYPLDDLDHLPPFNRIFPAELSIGCRCWITASVE